MRPAPRPQDIHGVPRRLRGLQQHPEHACIHVRNTRPRLAIRDGENAFRSCFVGKKTLDEIIDGGAGGFALHRDGIAQVISLHGSMIPEPENRTAPAMSVGAGTVSRPDRLRLQEGRDVRGRLQGYFNLR